MTTREQTIARQVSQCQIRDPKDKHFVQQMGFFARHDPTHRITYKQCQWLGHLAWRYRQAMVRHGAQPQGRTPTLDRDARHIPITAITKTRKSAGFYCYGLSGRHVLTIEPIEYYFCQAAGVPEVTIAALSQQTECPEQECQLILQLA